LLAARDNTALLLEEAARINGAAVRKAFEEGKLTLEDLRNYAIEQGEPKTISGRQEYLENLVNRFI